MMQKYSIFTNNHSVAFVNTPSESHEIIKISLTEGVKFSSIYEQLNTSGNTSNFEIICKNPKQAFDEYSLLFTPIAAAGGAVFNKQGQLLWINRLKKWDLPKGKLEEGETILECALREVAEECGLELEELHSVQPLPNTYHTYELKGQRILKTTYWFEMLYTGNRKGEPQVSEDIHEVVWLGKTESESNALSDTYANIRELFMAVEWKE